MKVIAFAGQFHTGKDTAADYLAKKLNKFEKWGRTAFAFNVKKALMDVFQVDADFIEEWKRKKEIPKNFDIPIREALTLIGDGFRKIYRDIWVDLVFRNQKNNLIISDERYISEAKHVKKRNGINVLIWRVGFENDFPSKSEQEVVPYVKICKEKGTMYPKNMPFDFFLANDGTIDDLYSKIDQYLLPFVKDFWYKEETLKP